MNSETSKCEDGFTNIPLDIEGKIINEVSPTLHSVLQNRYLGRNSLYPARSCQEIKHSNSTSFSGYYWLQSTLPGSQPEMVWCNMELKCGSEANATGWARIALVNISDDEGCPGGSNNEFTLVTNPIRFCRRTKTGYGCNSHIFSTKNLSYGRVCGRVTGIQIGTTDVFTGDQSQTPNDIDSPYIDGVSLTYGRPRKHIWTFASYISEFYNECPCSERSSRVTPTFVGEDYFCESGANTTDVDPTDVFDKDPLWDGKNCNNQEVQCCERPPWFYKPLDRNVTDDIEFRLCADQSDEQTAFTLIEIYIQ